MTTIKKVYAYERRTRPTGYPTLDNRKIKLVFTDGTVHTFYQNIDKSYSTIAWLVINKLLITAHTTERHSVTNQPYTVYFIKAGE